ncbi:hypothetical protein [Flavobacterium sp. N502540]|uniref:hypothetical protein n=1 Tax=Flavobacterium sp. N502540 TaxID=2986838 RepID=UPI002224AAD3|nr:hypothetical protein [Flavobacterium sp. N502540]
MKKHLYNLLTIVLLCLLIFSCSPENDYTSIEKQESALLIRSKEWLSSKSTISEKDVLWNSAALYQQSTETSFVAIIPVKSSNSFLLQKIILEINDYNITGKLWSFNFKDAQEIEDLQKIATHKILESFTGEVRITNLETMETRKDSYKQGIANGNNLFSKSSGAGVCNNCHGDEGAIKLNEVVVTGPGGSPWPNPITNPVNPPIVPIGGGIFGSGGGSSSNPLNITNQLTGKEKCLNDLLDQKGDSFVQDLLSNFKGKSEFDIKIGSKDRVFVTKDGVTSEVNGATHPPKNNVIEIEINTSRINAHSALDAARTILHEYIHADIFRKLNTTNTATGILDFKNTYDAYGNQHGAMAALYLESMKNALKDFHKNMLGSDYNKYTDYYGEQPSDAFYEAMAWGGLKDSNVKAWNDLPAAKKAEIENLARRANMLTKPAPCPN